MADNETLTWRFDPVDIDQLRLLARLKPGDRVIPMLDAQTFARATMMGRLRRRYPNASEREIGLKVLEELERANRLWSLPWLVP